MIEMRLKMGGSGVRILVYNNKYFVVGVVSYVGICSGWLIGSVNIEKKWRGNSTLGDS
jgi:hypothetical protein